jgi:hypothetical protein
LEIMGKFGAELMRRSKQWRQAVSDGWNGVRRFWRSFQEEANGGLVAGRMIRVGVGQDWE